MTRLLAFAILTLSAVIISSCSKPEAGREAIDQVAESYVKLCLDLGRYDPDFVDAYHGPPEWKPEPLARGQEHALPVAELCRQADAMIASLDAVNLDRLPDTERRRVRFLRAHIASAEARIRLVGGAGMSFDEESKALYGAVAPRCDTEALDGVLERLDHLVPGDGELAERVNTYRARFEVPKDRIDAVFAAAIAEARRRTMTHMELPEGESFDTEYVTGVSWGAYNWYKGDYRSLIQVNVDLPVYIGSPLELAVHEGYPGHHVQNLLLEKNMLRGQGWIEYSVQPLYCPQATLNEGGANYGIDIAFTEGELIAFTRDELFPLAGLDPEYAAEYLGVEKLTQQLRGARTEGVRRYLDGEMTAEEAIGWLQRYALLARDRAERYLQFADKYRSYVATYDVGLTLVRGYIERGAGDDMERRWQLMRDLYAVPHLPGDLE
jgi:hypothetical protein